MKTRSIKVNYVLNLSRVIVGTLVGIFTMPYINRTLGAESLGKVEYVNSIITYFLLFSALGIPMYGIRETARVRNDEMLRTKLVLELLAIVLVTTFFSYLVIFGLIIHLNVFKDIKTLIIVMSSMILFANLGVEWFYQGMEDQLFITLRYIFIRILTLVLLFIVVKTEEDYLWYGLIIVLTTVGSNFFNLIYLKKYLNFSGISYYTLNIKQHFKSILTIFVATVSVSIYLQLDNIMLGSIAGNESVGYYAMANKLIRFVILFITTLGAVLLPRMSNLVHTDKNQYYAYAQKAIKYILIIATPFTIIFILMAPEFTLLMAGAQFEPAVLTMQILSPIILIVGIAYFIGYLVFYPQGKERIYTVATIFSALFSIILNLYAIPKYGQNGTAAVAVISEILGVIIMIWFGKDLLKNIEFFSRSFWLYLTGGILIFFVIMQVKNILIFPLIINVIVICTISFMVFFGYLLLLKEQVVLEALEMVKSIWKSK